MDSRSDGPPFFFPDIRPLPGIGNNLWQAGYGGLWATGKTRVKAMDALTRLENKPKPITVNATPPVPEPPRAARGILIASAMPGRIPATMKREIAGMTRARQINFRREMTTVKPEAFALWAKRGTKGVRETGPYKRIAPLPMI